MLEIKPIYKINHERIEELTEVLHKSFKNVANEINLIENRSPLNNAYIEKKELENLIEKGLMMYGYYENDKIVGCVGILQSSIKDEYYLERLCVVPEKRHSGIGFDLLQHCENEVRNRNGKIIKIGIIDRNKKLKDWCIRNGFKEYELRTFKYLPFEVCIMKKEL